MRFCGRTAAFPAALTFAVAGVAAPSSVAAPSGDPARGKAVFARGAVWHDISPGVNRLGASHAGVVGRSAGTMPGFVYSAAMKNTGTSWTPAQLDAFHVAPARRVPGNRVVFPGLPSPGDRATVIADLVEPQ